MAITEACQVWIEQRCKEELAERESSDKPKSLRTIGKEIAGEILKYFEAQVNPSTISKRLERANATNVATESTTESDKVIQNNKQKDETITKKGTPRKRKKGGGRKPKSKLKENLDEQRLQQAYENFLKEVQISKANNWKVISKERVERLVENLMVLVSS